jgi:hypothetical protein
MTTGCVFNDEVGIAELKITKLDLRYSQFVFEPATPFTTIDIEFEGPAEPICYALSPDLRATLDDVPLDVSYFPGGYEDDSEVCTRFGSFSGYVPIYESPSSTLLLEDDSGSVSMTIADLRVRRQAILREPADGRLRLNDTNLIDLDRPNDVYKDLVVDILVEGSGAPAASDVEATYDAGTISFTMKTGHVGTSASVPVLIVITGYALSKVNRCDAESCFVDTLFRIPIPAIFEL